MKDNFTFIMKQMKICVIIPTYNNEKNLLAVIESVMPISTDIIVVNDGSTDSTSAILATLSGSIHVLEYTPNRGKGYALKTAFKEALKYGYDYALTMDSDGQHKATDIQSFVEKIQENPHALLVGSRGMKHKNMPQQNTFANRFSNFWFAVQTGTKLPDTQSGFRLYPIRKMKGMSWFTNRYETELEILVRCAWRNIRIIPIPIHVYYPPIEQRVSHFRPRTDFLRISLLNTCLCLLAFIYGYPSRFIRKLFSHKIEL